MAFDWEKSIRVQFWKISMTKIILFQGNSFLLLLLQSYGVTKKCFQSKNA